MYYLTGYCICCKFRYFEALCSKLNILWESNPPESIQNVNLPLCTNFGSNQCIILQVITFAANYPILQHFAANKSFFEKATILSQFRMSNYPCVPVLEVINVLAYKLLHLLQIMLFCSILQQIDSFFEKATLLIQFGMSNYPCVPSLVITNE